jgi:hypothetical protein
MVLQSLDIVKEHVQVQQWKLDLQEQQE